MYVQKMLNCLYTKIIAKDGNSKYLYEHLQVYNLNYRKKHFD